MDLLLCRSRRSRSRSLKGIACPWTWRVLSMDFSFWLSTESPSWSRGNMRCPWAWRVLAMDFPFCPSTKSNPEAAFELFRRALFRTPVANPSCLKVITPRDRVRFLHQITKRCGPKGISHVPKRRAMDFSLCQSWKSKSWSLDT